MNFLHEIFFPLYGKKEREKKSDLAPTQSTSDSSVERDATFVTRLSPLSYCLFHESTDYDTSWC